MTITDERVTLDTNVWIFGLRQQPEFPDCEALLQHLNQLKAVLPRQVLLELQANLVEGELKMLFRLLKQSAKGVEVYWDKAKMEDILKYQRLGCKLGDAALAAQLEKLGVRVLITENRHFLEEIKELAFRRLSAKEALTELKGNAKNK